MRFRLLTFAFAIPLTFLTSWGASYGQTLKDLDRDGLEDTFEQEILIRFLPEFRVSQAECAGLPAELLPGSTEPQVVALNGTIYGQVFPVTAGEISGSLLEVHYHHLWSRDCGRFGHQLDTEYVSVLLRSERPEAPAGGWKSLYWYAAAHEGTLCDASNGGRVNLNPIQNSTVTIWISSGKHASFLSQELCQKVGCGGDRCERMIPFVPDKIINLGEPGAPLNGAVWTAFRSWPLADKMEVDFDESLRRRLEGLEETGVRFVGGQPPPLKAVLLGGNKSIGALEKGQLETGDAVTITSHQAGRNVHRGLREAGGSLQDSVKKVGRWLGIGR